MKKIFYLLFVVVFVNIGCRKDAADFYLLYNSNPLNDTAWNNNLTSAAVSNTLFQALRLQPYVDSFEASNSTLFRINSKLELNVPSACLQSANGTHVLAGKVKLELRFVQSKGDFIRYAKPTTSQGKLMESAMAMEVKFFHQNQELFMQPGKKLFFTIKDANPESNMMVYFGNFQPQLPLPQGANPFFAWVHSTDSSFVTPFIRQDSTGVTKGYQLFSGKTNWINCMKQMDSVHNKTNINIILPLNFTNNNTSVFAIFEDGKSIVQLNGDMSTRTFLATGMPVGETVKFVTLSLIGNQYYLGCKEININQNFIITINPTAKSVDEISHFLTTL